MSKPLGKSLVSHFDFTIEGDVVEWIAYVQLTEKNCERVLDMMQYLRAVEFELSNNLFDKYCNKSALSHIRRDFNKALKIMNQLRGVE